MNIREAGEPRPQGAADKPLSRLFVAVQNLPLIYVNMPKSGCTTIKNLLHRIDRGTFLADPLTIHRRKDLFAQRRPRARGDSPGGSAATSSSPSCATR